VNVKAAMTYECQDTLGVQMKRRLGEVSCGIMENSSSSRRKISEFMLNPFVHDVGEHKTATIIEYIVTR